MCLDQPIFCSYPSNPVITHNVIQGNEGGGIYCSFDVSVNISNNLITRNIGLASGPSGGIVCDRVAAAQISSNIISENSSGAGAGISITKSIPNPSIVEVVENNLIVGNESFYNGGGIHLFNSNPLIVNNTVVGNIATNQGGGIYTFRSPATIVNSIMWDNEAPDGDQIYVYLDEPSVTYSLIESGWLGEGNIDDEPRFENVTTGDYRLASFSPGIDASNGDLAPPLDKNGSPRFDDRGIPNTGIGVIPYVDMGAYERQRHSRRPIPHVVDIERN